MTTPNNIGGYDYHFVKKPLDMFVCKICHLPSRDPHLSMCCGHIFCKSCLDNAKEAITTFPQRAHRRIPNVCPTCRTEDYNTVPNKQIYREVMGLHIFCTNKEKGCTWQGEINDINCHLKNTNGCQFEIVKCLNACGMLMQRQLLMNHVETKCPQHVIECQYCKIKRKRHVIIGTHTKQCPKLPLPCPNALHGCTEDKIPRENIKKHREVCQYETVQCYNVCGKEMQRQYLTNHVETDCPCRKVACQYCQCLYEYWFLESLHAEKCIKFPLPCPNDCGIKDIPRKDVDKHRKGCPLEIIECTNECGKEMVRQNLTDHLQNKCPRRLIHCPYCNTEGENQFILGDHMRTCNKFPLTCPNECDIGTVCRGDMDEHRKTCLLETTDCVYCRVGCKAKMQRKDLEKHSNETMKEHLLLTAKNLNDTGDKLRERVHMLEIAAKKIARSTILQPIDKIALWPFYLQLASSSVANTPDEHMTPVIMKMSNYAQNKLQKKKWFSPPFYSHKNGYKMCLSVYPNGHGKSEGTHMTVCLHLMKGPYDDHLLWPLEGIFQVKLLNQISDTQHHSEPDHFVFDAKKNVCRVRNLNITSGWGYSSFISNENLHKVAFMCQFLKDDSVFFEIRYTS